MASLELDRFRIVMERFFRHYVDEFKGPIYGPGGPHMTVIEPNPLPWRELSVAFEAVKLAEAFEFATAGSGVAFIQKFVDDPDDWCGTRVPGRPRPKGDEGRLDIAVLGAALDFVARGVSHEELAESVRGLGNSMIG